MLLSFQAVTGALACRHIALGYVTTTFLTANVWNRVAYYP